MRPTISLRKEFMRVLFGGGGVYASGTVLSFLVGIMLARSLGVAGYGLYGSAMAAATLGATAAAGGIQLHAAREIARLRARLDRGGISRLVRWSLGMALPVAIGTGLLASAYVKLGHAASLDLAIATLAVTISSAFLFVIGAVVRGLGAIVMGQAMQIALRPMAYAILLFLAIQVSGKVEPALAMSLTAVAIGLTLLVGIPYLAKVWRTEHSSGDTDLRERGMWRRATLTMGLGTIIHAAETSLPLMLIGSLSNLTEAGLYRVASSAMVIVAMPTSMFSVMFPPIVARLYEKRETSQLNRVTVASSIVMSLSTLAVAIVIWGFGKPLLGFAFGTDFRPAWATLAILAAASVIVAFGGISVVLLHSARRELVVTRAFGMSLVISVLGSVWVAPWAGALGVACVVLVSALLRTVYLAVKTKQLVGVDPSLLGVLKRSNLFGSSKKRD